MSKVLSHYFLVLPRGLSIIVLPFTPRAGWDSFPKLSSWNIQALEGEEGTKQPACDPFTSFIRGTPLGERKEKWYDLILSAGLEVNRTMILDRRGRLYLQNALSRISVDKNCFQ